MTGPKPKDELVVFGCGGHAKLAVNTIRKLQRFEILGYVDREGGGTFLDRPVYSEAEFLAGNIDCTNVCLAIGENYTRWKIHQRILASQPETEFPTLLDPTAIIAENVRIGVGTIAMPGVIVNTFSNVGTFCILNTGSFLGHDGNVGDFASLAPRSSVGGDCRIDAFGFVGLGASVIHGVRVGQNAVLGSGGTAVDDLEDDHLYLGLPARKIRRRQLSDPILGRRGEK